MKKITFLFTLALFSLFAHAQQIVTEPKPFIEITGTSEIKIDPNQIFIQINLRENLDRGKRTLDEMEQDLIKALIKEGISSDKLAVKDANAYYGKTGLIGKDVVRSKQLELEVKDATEARKAFKVLDEQNIQNAYISRVDHTEMDEYKKQAKIKAIKAAKEKATYLLEAVDEQLGKALEVREISPMTNRYTRLPNSRIAAIEKTSYANNNQSINLDFKQITISAQVYTKWRIGEE